MGRQLPDGSTYVWKHMAEYKYMKASAFVVDCHFLEFDRLTAYRTFSIAFGVHTLFLKVIELDSVCHTITLSAP